MRISWGAILVLALIGTLAAAVGVERMRGPLAPHWTRLPSLTLEELEQAWGTPEIVDATPEGHPFRALFPGSRHALIRDGQVVHLFWQEYPIGGRSNLARRLGVPQEALQFRPDSLFAGALPGDSLVLIEALDNGDRTWTVSMLRWREPQEPRRDLTREWLLGSEP